MLITFTPVPPKSNADGVRACKCRGHSVILLTDGQCRHGQMLEDDGQRIRVGVFPWFIRGRCSTYASPALAPSNVYRCMVNGMPLAGL